MKLPSRIGAIFDKMLWALFVLSCLLLLFILLSVCSGVVMRYFVGRPLMWVVEFSGYSMLFFTFLSAAWTLKQGGHVRITLVLDRLSPRAQVTLNTIVFIVAAIVWLVVTWYSGQVTWDSFQSGTVTELTMLELPIGPLLAIIPVGSFLLFIQSLRGVYGCLGKARIEKGRQELRAAG